MNTSTGMVRIGWMTFFTGSVMFVVDAVRLHDAISAGASLLFVVGVIAFVRAERLPEGCASCGRPLPSDGISRNGRCYECHVLESAREEPTDGLQTHASAGLRG